MEPRLNPGLYIVATPIGNLGDISARALEVLRGVSAVACEDTRVTGKLLHLLGIKQRLIRHDDHASDTDRDGLLALAAREPVALACDAGTPLISDPGYRLVRAARERGVVVTSLPGPSAAIVALSMSGLPTDRFLFAGFLPPKAGARAAALAELSPLRATLVFYETAPRVAAMLTDLGAAMPGREVAVARELTKLHEELRTGSAAELAVHFAANPTKGEIVVLAGPPPAAEAQDWDLDAMLRAELAHAKPSQAAAAVAKATGADRKVLYARAMELK